MSQYCAERYGKHTGFASLSFTNKACAELKQKYREMHDERLTFPNEVLTIDSFIMQYVVLPFWYLCDACKKKPIVVNEEEILNPIYFNNVFRNGKWNSYPIQPLSKFGKKQYDKVLYKKSPALVSREKNGYRWNHNTINKAKEVEYCETVFTYRLSRVC